MTDTHMPPALRFMLAARRSELAGLESLAQTCVLVTSVSQLVHALQRERGYSNVYLGCNDARHLTQLEALSADARAVEQRVVMCFQDIDLESAAVSDRARLFNRLAFVMHALDELPGLRRRIRDQRVSAIDATSMMTRLIGGLLAVVFEAADSAVDPHITRILVALFNFMQGKELAGQERAAGVAGFSAGFFDEQSRSKVEHFVHGQTRCFQTFVEFAQHEAVAIWETQQASETATQINRLRGVALKTSERDRVDASLSQMWFELATLRIDAMRDVETCLTDGLLRRCQASIKQARADLDNHRVLLNRLISLEAAGPEEHAMLFNVQAVELDSPPDEGLGHHLGRSVLDMLQLQTRRLISANDERDEARQALAERKVVERAKQLLMAEFQLSEGDAYERLRVASMERGQRMLDVSQAVLEKVAVRKNRR